MKYDIKEFNPSITEKPVNEALNLASEYLLIPEDKIYNIKHYRESLLYHNEDLWIKKGVSCNFDNTMGAFDGADYANSSVVYCYTISIILLTTVTMVFIEIMSELLYGGRH